MSYYSPSKQYINKPLSDNYEVERQTKVNILRKEFLEIDISHVEYISKVELYNILDNKIGRAFDREVAEQLYSRMNKDYQGKITIDDFIKVFLEAEEILKSKIHNTRKSLEDIYRTRKEYLTKLEEVRQTEILNNFGVMQGAYLTVTVISGHNLGYNGSKTDPFITMYLNDQKFETGTSNLNPNQTYTWQSPSHKFLIYTGTESLQIQVSDFDQYTKENFIGQITIPLRSLNDQNTITQEYQLYNQNGHLQTGGSIVLQLQYVYSRVKFLESIITQKNEEIQSIENDLMEFERDIETLYQPFKALQRFYRNPSTMVAQNLQSEFITTNNNLAQQSNPKGFRVQHEDEQIKAIPLGPNPYENIGLYTRILTISLLIITLAQFFEKTPYFDLMIIFFYVYKYELNELNETSCIKIISAYMISIFTEIFWLVFFAEHWWNPNKNQMYDTMLDSGFRKANVVVAFISIINKIFLCACFWGLVQFFKNNPVEEQLQLIRSKHQISPRRQFLQEQRPYLENSDFKVDKIFITPEKINTNKSYITYQDQSINQQNLYYQPKY